MPDTSLRYLYDYLRRYHLSNSLVLTGAISAALKYGYRDFWKDGIKPPVIDWLKVNCRSQQEYLTILTGITRLSRFLILSGANDHRDKTLSLNDGSFGKALNLAGGIYEAKVEKELLPANTHHMFARLVQWQIALQGDQMSLIGRAYLLFIILVKKVEDEYSFDENLRKHFGIGTFEFMATGLMIWLKSNGYEGDLLDIQIHALKTVATDENQARFLELSSGTPELYRRALRGDNWKNTDLVADCYGLDPFYLMPAIKINHSSHYKPDAFAIPQLYYLLERAANGIFFLLSDREQTLANAAGHPDKNPFRVAFGKVYRDYVGLHLNQANRHFTCIDLDEELTSTKGKSPDFALIYDQTCILIEVKTNLLNVRARSYFEPEVLSKEIKKGVFDKAMRQLHEFSEQILAGKIQDNRFNAVQRVIKLLIGYDDIFTLNTLLLSLLTEYYEKKAENLQLACVTDVEAMGTLIAQGENLVDWITKKNDHPQEKYHAFVTDLEKAANVRNPVLENSFNDLWLKLVGGRL